MQVCKWRVTRKFKKFDRFLGYFEGSSLDASSLKTWKGCHCFLRMQVEKKCLLYVVQRLYAEVFRSFFQFVWIRCAYMMFPVILILKQLKLFLVKKNVSEESQNIVSWMSIINNFRTDLIIKKRNINTGWLKLLQNCISIQSNLTLNI